MKNSIQKKFKLEINYFKHLTFFFNTIYFLRNLDNFKNTSLKYLLQTNANVVYLNFKELFSESNDINIILEKYILDNGEKLFLLDFEEIPEENLLTFLNNYCEKDKKQKNPIIILNNPKKFFKNKKIIKNTKRLGFIYYLVLKYGTNKKIDFKKSPKEQPKNKKKYMLGFNVLSLLSFIFMALFGSTTQYVKMSALLESMTYFMNNQPINSRIHAVYHEHFESLEERTSNETRNKYSNLQRETISYGLGSAFNSYFISGTADKYIEFDVNFVEYTNSSYEFKTKLIGQSVYSNQNRILMENIDLEQYLIKQYAHHSPIEGADAVYYMPSNIADELINISNDGVFKTYSDFIGRLINVSYKADNIFFEQVMSINNIFYTSDISANIGEPIDANEYVNVYGGKDKNLGEHMLTNIGNFGVSTSTRIHRYFGSAFCIDFFGYNKSLKMMLDRNFSDDLRDERNYFEYFYLNKSILQYDIDLNSINNFYRKDGFLIGANYLYLFLSFLLISGGLYLFFLHLKTNKENIVTIKKQFLSYLLLTSTPFIISQLLFLWLIIFMKYNSISISLMNVVGSPFSLIVTAILLLNLFVFAKGHKKSVYKIQI